MKCPIDTTIDLIMTDRQGIEIDYCPTCRGVWLDRGELDKIIERAAASLPRPSPVAAFPAPAPVADRERERVRDRDDDDDDWDDRHDHRHLGKKPKKKRSSFLGDMFDF
jgi:Zn-finger nucleic acid-binding protein